MANTLAKMLEGIDLRPPARADAIAEFEKMAGLSLPDNYVKFLRLSIGAEGFLGDSVYVIFWPIEDLLDLNIAYEVSTYAPDLLLFGSDGGGEAFAFDTRSSSMIVVKVPFVGMAIDLAQGLSDSFSGFVKYLYELDEDE